MKTSQYLRLEKGIAAHDSGGIGDRWMWGLRLLNDPSAWSSTGKTLRRGVSDVLVKSARACGFRLSDREIQYRLQCARAYPSKAEFDHAVIEFPTWFDLIQAGFPPYEVSPDEPPADWRDVTERRRDQNRAMLEHDHQGGLFPDEYESPATLLRAMKAYTEELNRLAANHTAHCAKRTAYLDQLLAAAGNDLDMTRGEAEARLAAQGAGEIHQDLGECRADS